ncbi:MAG: DUF86 domain-containing protein [Chitinivibrionales bacterium]|nr:DUF86 domain-containing protein [Chitinivibrionales bacterium]
MEKLRAQIELCEKAVATFKEILEEPYTVIVRDASIQRFEYSFETLWKTCKVFLNIVEGVRCDTPKSCFRNIFKAGVVNEDQAEKLLIVTDDRNLTSHTYIEAVAATIYSRLRDHYSLMDRVLQEIKARSS